MACRYQRRIRNPLLLCLSEVTGEVVDGFRPSRICEFDVMAAGGHFSCDCCADITSADNSSLPESILLELLSTRSVTSGAWERGRWRYWPHPFMTREKMAWFSQRGVDRASITTALLAKPGTKLMRPDRKARIPARTTGAGCMITRFNTGVRVCCAACANPVSDMPGQSTVTVTPSRLSSR